MAKVITISSIKGGVSKSTCSIFLAKILSEKCKVLLIDMDQQNSISSYMYPEYDPNKTILEVLLGKLSISEVLLQVSERLDFIPADISLSSLGIALSENRDFKLFSILETIRDNYDWIIIDTPPSLDIQTRMSLVIAEVIIIPTLLEQWSKRAVDILLAFIQTKNIPLQKIIKTDLEATYILPSMVEQNRKLSQIILGELKESYEGMILPGISRRSDVQKLSAIGKDAPLEKTLAYSEYKAVTKIISGGK